MTVKTENYITPEGIEFRLVRKKIRYIRIKITPPDGAVTVSAPPEVSLAEVKKAVSEKSEFIKKAKIKFTYPQKKYVSGELFSVWGKYCPVKIYKAEKNCCVCSGELLEVYVKDVSDRSAIEKTILKYYKESLEEKLKELLPRYEKLTGLKCSGWKVKNMRTRWGSCNHNKKSLNFSLNLAKYPQICTEYVIVHELLHILFPNHGADFKLSLKKYFPKEKEAVSCLKSNKYF